MDESLDTYEIMVKNLAKARFLVEKARETRIEADKAIAAAKECGVTYTEIARLCKLTKQTAYNRARPYLSKENNDE